MSIRTRRWTTRKGEQREAYIVDYYDKAGKRHIETFEKLKDAKARQNEIGVDIKDGVHVPRSTSITVAEACDVWLEDRRAFRDEDGNPLEESTLKQYGEHIRLHIKPSVIGKTKLADLTGPHLKQFATSLIKGGASAAMQKKVMASLSSVLSCAYESGYINRLIAVGRKGKKNGSKRHKKHLEIGVDIPTVEEIQRFLKALDGSTWRPFFVLAINTGMRASEMRGLKWANVELGKDKGVIHVRERADYKNRIGSPKSATSRRDIPIGPVVVNALKEHLLKATDKTGLVFPTRDAKEGAEQRTGGKPQSVSNIYKRVLAPLMIKAGLTVPVLDEKGRPVMAVDKKGEPVLDEAGNPVPAVEPKYSGLHAFRHFHASMLINPVGRGGRGMDPKEVQERLGHSTLAMTMDVYGHLFPKKGDDTRIAEAELALLG
jgi:integrase